MIPRTAVLAGVKAVCVKVVWSDRTLSNSRYTICMHLIQHSKAMPMNGSSVMIEFIFNPDMDSLEQSSAVLGLQ